MHMADALISPAVGGALWAATAAATVHASRALRNDSPGSDDRRVPLMGVLGAFIFAAQMINFSIPGTGSSGHLGGGVILAAMLGPHAAFLTLASVLVTQALFFADGGLLALGCNIFNMGFLTCYVAYPLLFKPIAGTAPSPARLTAASMVAAVVGLQLGALGVVLETTASGVTELSFGGFSALMLPIHLAIGVVEGLATAALLGFVRRARPEILDISGGRGSGDLKKVLIGFAVAALVIGGALSWFASSDPDGLEWSVAQATGKAELEAPQDGPHAFLAELQRKIAPLPDYGLGGERPTDAAEPAGKEEAAWPAVDPGASLSGVVGGALTLGLVGLVGWLLRRRSAS